MAVSRPGAELGSHLSGAVQLRPYQGSDAAGVVQFLSGVLERLYPTGGEWLNRKLRDPEGEGTICMLAETGSALLGLTIETVKDLGRRKLSTILVDEASRGLGVGTALIESCLDRWRHELLKEVYVTASLSVVGALALLLVPRGFQYRAIERERYGAGRDEVVLAWTPAGGEASADHGWVNDQLSRIRSLHTN